MYEKIVKRENNKEKKKIKVLLHHGRSSNKRRLRKMSCTVSDNDCYSILSAI